MFINLIKACEMYLSLVKQADLVDLTQNFNPLNTKKEEDDVDSLINQVNQFNASNKVEEDDESNNANKLLGLPERHADIAEGIPEAYIAKVQSMKLFNRNLPDSFWFAFIKMCERLGTPPQNVAKVIRNESKFDPKAVNYQTVNGKKKPIAKGLNQIIKGIGTKIGMPPGMWDNFENMTAEQQLPWVEKSFRASNIKGNMSATDIYARNFGGFPNPDGSMYASKAYIDKHPQKDKFQRPDFQDLAYRQNIGLDKDHKGYIAKKDLSRLVGE